MPQSVSVLLLRSFPRFWSPSGAIWVGSLARGASTSFFFAVLFSFTHWLCASFFMRQTVQTVWNTLWSFCLEAACASFSWPVPSHSSRFSLIIVLSVTNKPQNEASPICAQSIIALLIYLYKCWFIYFYISVARPCIYRVRGRSHGHSVPKQALAKSLLHMSMASESENKASGWGSERQIFPSSLQGLLVSNTEDEG